MLQRDYIIDLIRTFCASVVDDLRRALLRGDGDAAVQAEAAVGELLDLDPSTALALSPQSLVTMMQLSGIGDSVASYVSYTLNRLGDAYERVGAKDTGKLRHDQAAAVAVAFGWNLSTCPEEFEGLELELKNKKGRS